MRLDHSAVVVFGAGVLLFVVLLVVALISFRNTLRDRHVRRVSPVSLVLPILALGCIAVLNNAALIGAESFEPRAALQLVFLVVIPVCVIVASACASSFLEPFTIAILLILVPFIGDFMPYHSGPRNPVWHRGAGLPEWGPAEELLMVLAVFIVPAALIGFGVHYVSRKLRARQWTWSPLRGLAWGFPCGVGAMLAVRRKMALDIAFGGDYTMVWVILGTFVVITGLGGLKRTPHAVQQVAQSMGPADGEAPLGLASTETTNDTAVTDEGSGGAGAQSALGGPIAHRRRMVSGAKFGLTLLCLYVAFIVSLLIGHSWWEAFHHYVGTERSEMVGYVLLFGLPILIGIAGLIAGIQKGRPGIGVLALFTTPIGFFFALAAKDRRVGAKRPVAHKQPMVSGAKFGLTVICLLATLIVSLFALSASGWHEIHQYLGTHKSEMIGLALLFGLLILIGIAGLITGIQKGRPGIGVLALFTTPIGFFFALAATDRRAGPERPVARKRPMASAAKCGLLLFCLYVVFMALVVVQPEPIRDILSRIPDHVGYALMFGPPILIGIAGLITGIQKGRPGIGVLALLTTPIGFFFALAAEDRRART